MQSFFVISHIQIILPPTQIWPNKIGLCLNIKKENYLHGVKFTHS